MSRSSLMLPRFPSQEMRLEPADGGARLRASCARFVRYRAARCVIAGKSVRVLDAAPADVPLGEGAVAVKSKRVYLGLSDGAVNCSRLSPMARRAMTASAWAAGLQGADLTWGVLS